MRAVTRSPIPRSFPPASRRSSRPPTGCPAPRRCSSTPARWAMISPTSSTRPACRGHEACCVVGHQRRRRLLAATVAVSRRPQQGGRAARRRLRPGVGQPAADGVRDQLRRHVGGADQGRRRGQRAVRAASTAPIVEADIAAVAAHALLTDELVGQRIPLTGPQALTNTELVASSARFSIARCATTRCRPSSCASASSASGSRADSPTPTWRCWRRRVSTSRHWSPTRWRRFSAGPRRRSPRVAAHRELFTNSKGDKTCRIPDHRATSSR